MDQKSKVRPIYSEFMGMLSQAPKTNTYMYKDQKDSWERYNQLTQKLFEITNDDEYSTLKIEPRHDDSELIVNSSEYRTKVSALISRLHGTFFYDESAPFSGMPSTVINQNQSQQQTTQIAFLLETQSAIDKKLSETQDEKEKGFLNSVKSNLANIKNFMEFVQLVVNTAQTFGISLDKLSQIFK
ncbi:MAG: hypothetical protein UX25_C0039G0006 [Candidatus Woesebacteria bacterium GW2011_GWC2_45_9]|uniref:Uncharacterized protein n=2 Tax=Microgenomates group TaxID=1794810 RepID=A0A0G1N6Q9_9BACT|nr:MAG: hypothetical protein UW61_C0020G0006 [Candidatus Curtissbacteria bacterium GW2011_GWC1_44_33]KKU16219.1 MAG: hypothetical protein UX25_C0039G0006 [Candidatus Woesebacteria bacterium GW2011_GWC2_45_9]